MLLLYAPAHSTTQLRLQHSAVILQRCMQNFMHSVLFIVVCHADNCNKLASATKRPRFTGWLTLVGPNPEPFKMKIDGEELVTEGNVFSWAVEGDNQWPTR